MDSAFQVMAKPIGPLCNLNCKYCYYLEKRELFKQGQNTRMSGEVLERFIQQYISSQRTSSIQFYWQGGEPTLLGVEYFQEIVRLQEQYSDGRQISNSIQTNAVLLDDEWCEFLAENRFLVGVSIDGPAELHDKFRLDNKQNPSHSRVIEAIERLQAHGVEFNSLTVVNRVNGNHSLKVYQYLRDLGIEFMQFIPLVERKMGNKRFKKDAALAGPPDLSSALVEHAKVTSWSVRPEQYGRFLTTIFDEWISKDVGSIFIQAFETAIRQWMGDDSDICVFAKECGHCVALEHDGSIYACDHYVYPNYHLGNLMNAPISEIVNQDRQHAFGSMKESTLSDVCRTCPVGWVCNGGCPKHRFIRTSNQNSGMNYLCAGYKEFFQHIEPTLLRLRRLLYSGQPAARIMEFVNNSKKSQVN